VCDAASERSTQPRSRGGPLLLGTDPGPRPGSVNPLDPREEGDLVERAKRDTEAFGRLYERHRVRVYQFVCSRLRNSYYAEYLTAEVFMRGVAGDRSVPVDRRSIHRLVYRIQAAGVVVAHGEDEDQRYAVASDQVRVGLAAFLNLADSAGNSIAISNPG
jgi:hypothetical protein